MLARENPDVDDGWLCDKGRFAYQAIHSDERIAQPLVRDGGELRPVGWERALEAAASALGKRARGRVGALVGGETTNEEGWLSSGSCARCSARRTSTPAPAATLPLGLHRALAAPALQAEVRTSGSPTPCWCSTPSRSTTRRSSTCGSARGSGAAA